MYVSQRFFFYRENQNVFRENVCQFLGFHSWFFFSLRENTLKNCQWNTRSVRESFFQITYVKMGTSVREKYNLLFPWNLAKFTFFCTREKNFSSVKIIKISLFSSREKENPSVKKSKNASVKTLDCPWKCWKKCAWKPLLLPWKKSKTGRNWLSREKKTLLLPTCQNRLLTAEI